METLRAAAFKEFIEYLNGVEKRLKYGLEVTSSDEEEINFTIAGRYAFTFTGGEPWVPDDRKPEVPVSYQLCIWHQVGGGRHSPPEMVDTPLIDSDVMRECVVVAFETVAKEQIRQAMEDITIERIEEAAHQEEM